MNTFGSRLVTFEILLLSLALLAVAVVLSLSPAALAPPAGPPAFAGRIVALEREAPTSTRAAPAVRLRIAHTQPFETLAAHWFGGRPSPATAPFPLVNDLVLPPTEVDATWVPGTAVAVWTAGDAPGLVTMIGPASDFGTPAPARDTLPPTDAAPVAMLGALGLLGLVYAAFRLRRHRLARAPAPTDAATRPWFAATSAGLHEPDGIHHHD